VKTKLSWDSLEVNQIKEVKRKKSIDRLQRIRSLRREESLYCLTGSTTNPQRSRGAPIRSRWLAGVFPAGQASFSRQQRLHQGIGWHRPTAGENHEGPIRLVSRDEIRYMGGFHSNGGTGIHRMATFFNQQHQHGPPEMWNFQIHRGYPSRPPLEDDHLGHPR